MVEGVKKMKQVWFSGCHSDVYVVFLFPTSNLIQGKLAADECGQ